MKFGWRMMPLPETLADVALILGMEEKELSYLLTQVHRLFYYKDKPKPNGKVRRLTCPARSLERSLDCILGWLNGYYPHHAAHGWRAGRSTATCADPHIGQEVVLKFDIEDFFPNISHQRVRETLRHLGCGEEAASVLTKLTTVNGSLPQGFATSPALANLVFIRCDARVAGLCGKLNFNYTRYGDDLIVSGRDVRRRYIIHSVREILADSGYSLNEEKFRKGGVRLASQRQEVVGIVVNRKRGLPKEKIAEYKRNIRDLNAAIEAGDESLSQASSAQVRGQISYTKQICPTTGQELEEMLVVNV